MEQTLAERMGLLWAANPGCKRLHPGSGIVTPGDALEGGIVVQDRRVMVFGDRRDEIVERGDAEVLR